MDSGLSTDGERLGRFEKSVDSDSLSHFSPCVRPRGTAFPDISLDKGEPHLSAGLKLL